MMLHRKGLSLGSKLILTYSLVALLALVVAGLVALPLLQGYQNERIDQERLRKALEYGGNLDALRVLISNQQSDRNPFQNLLVTNPKAAPNQRSWPAAPAIETLRQKFNDLAVERGLRIMVITINDRVVKVDTTLDTTTSLQGEMLPSVQPNPAPTPPPASSVRTLPTPPETTLITRTGHQYSLYYLPVRGDNAPNLFGLNARQRPLEYILAVVVPAIPAPEVWQDLMVILGVAALAALLLSTVIGFLLARSMSRPVVRLTEATHAVAQGDYEQRVLPQGGIELTRLAESFNQMTYNVAEAQRMQRQLIANVSHELKTPLTSIQGFSQAMLDGVLRRPEDFNRSATIIVSEASRMIRLVNGLLDLSQLESRQAALHSVELDLAQILNQCLESFAPRALAVRVDLIQQYQSPIIICGDADRLRQVFNNLIDNALKYSNPSGSLLLSAHSSGNVIEIKVVDSGSGISAVDLPYIFERFYQADKSRRRDQAHEGTGLGLAICKEIIEAHKGKIKVFSEVGRGTQFVITLPAIFQKSALKALPPTQPLRPVQSELINK